ncbi:DUF4384 domain-containing protein [Sphaerotilus mobilis]|uniref:Uncharacterized protein DUF4384 n=1 Tax=Sphaerotilus mobilis TaxID=47994 RepID=A0A4V2EWT5_9BURK|nr:DUF4384 domain-containing protein [Sphaerotilus mobilis]RZS57110.1 uncharacterized protein DUF4384 [Sphaerotilus mobilis]
MNFPALRPLFTVGLLTLAGLCSLLTGCAATSSAAPAANVATASVQQLDTVLRGAASNRPVSLQLSTNQVRTGDTLGVQLRATRGGHAYLFQLGTDGKTLSMVFPNAVDGANHLAPDTTLVLPRETWRMTARGPAGLGYMLAVVTDQPLDLLALQAQVQSGKLEIAGAYGAGLAALREVAP